MAITIQNSKLFDYYCCFLNNGRILVNENLKVEGPEDVFALGDCAVQHENPLPMIAQAAKQQAIYLGKVLNKDHKKPFR